MIECHDCVTTWPRVCIINLVFTHILGSKSVRVPALVISLDMLHAMTSLPRHVLLLVCLDKCLVIHSFILQPLNIYFIRRSVLLFKSIHDYYGHRVWEDCWHLRLKVFRSLVASSTTQMLTPSSSSDQSRQTLVGTTPSVTTNSPPTSPLSGT